MTYKVGTRVKKVRLAYRAWEEIPVGTVGVIVCIDRIVSPNADVWDCIVRYDGFGNRVALFGCIEPIIPEGSNVPSEATIHELLDSKFYEKENCNV